MSKDKPNAAQVLCDLALKNPSLGEMMAQVIPIVMELDARVAFLEEEHQKRALHEGGDG